MKFLLFYIIAFSAFGQMFENKVTFDIGKERVELIQKIKVTDCDVEVYTDHPKYGNIHKEKFNLKKEYPFKRAKKLYGTYGLMFGVRSMLRGGTYLNFDEKQERDVIFTELSKISKTCIDSGKLSEISNPSGDFFNQAGGKNEVAALDGPRSFYERVRILSEAKKSIYYQTLTFRGDLAGRYLADILIKKKSEGLDVKVIADGLGTGIMDNVQIPIDKDNTYIMLNNMMASGIRVFGYACKNAEINELRGFAYVKLLGRNHEKMIIADDRSAVMGGINTAQEYFGLSGANERSWRDQDIGIRGPVVKDISNGFMRNFTGKEIEFRTYKYDYLCLNPHNPKSEKVLYEKFKKEHTQPFNPYQAEDVRFANIISENIENYRLGRKIGVPLFDDREIRYRDGTFLRFVLHRPREKEQEGQDVYVELINRANKTIKIHQAMFIPTKSVLEALKAASRRGVDIKIVTRSEEKVNLPAIKIVGRSYYFEIYKASMEGNAEFYQWNGNGVAGSTHAKFMIVDGIEGVIGSFNLESSSLSNAETLMVFLGDKIAEDLTNLFNRDLTYSRKHSVEELIKYSYPENVKEDRRLNFWKKLENLL